MSSVDARLRYQPHDLRRVSRKVRDAARTLPKSQMSIVPTQSIAGRALLGVMAVMSFLAALTLGAVVMVRTSAGDWQSQVAREVTIQVRPVEGQDIETQVMRAALITRASRGIAQVRPYTREQSLRLLEPWLGSGLTLDELPVPRLIVVTLAAEGQPDLARLRQSLTEQVPGASLDDHRSWVERMRAMTRAAVTVGFGVLGLMLFATVLLVAFATRGAMAANRGIVEVLHFVGAKNRFIAGQFQRHFLALGLKGAALGGGGAIAIFLAIHLAGGPARQTLDEQGVSALFGALALKPEGYAGIVGVIVLVAAVAALTSRWTVHRTLNSLD